MITIIVTALALIVDQISKYLVNDFFSSHPHSLPIIENIFHLSYVKNTGIAFGLYADNPNVLLIVLVVTVCFLAIYALTTPHTHWIFSSAYGLILGGAIGNITDRIMHKAVIDFLDFRIWPVFNVADTFISIGVGILIIEIIFFSKKTKE